LAAVVRHKTNDGFESMRSERGLSTIPHCLGWYKLVLRTRLSTLVSLCAFAVTVLLTFSAESGIIE